MAIDLAIIIPCYNEEEGIEKTIKELQKKTDFKIIVIDDGSTDKTGEILSKIKNIHVIKHSTNKGYGASLKSGVKESKTEFIAFYDADGQHRPEDLLAMANNIGNYDMLIGERGKDSHQDWIRKPGKWVLGKVANYLSGKKIPDLNSGLRVIRTKIIYDLLHLFPDGFSFSTTSTIAFMNMGFKTGYYPIKVRKRVGSSTVKQLKHGSSTLLLILRLIVLFNPLKVFIPASFMLIGLGIIYEVIWGILLIEGFSLIPGALLLILTGVIIFFTGLMTEQISETRKYLFMR